MGNDISKLEKEANSVNLILQLMVQIKIEDMDIVDQLRFVQLLIEFSNEVKPFVKKYVLSQVDN